MASFDAWKTTDPDDATLGRSYGHPTQYRCLDCPWRDSGYVARAEHYQHTGHRVVWTRDPRPSPANESAA